MRFTIEPAFVLLNAASLLQVASPFSIQTCTSGHRLGFRRGNWLARQRGLVCNAETVSSSSEGLRYPVVIVLSYDGSRFDGWQDNTPKARSSTEGIDGASSLSTSTHSPKGASQKTLPKKARTVQAVLEKFLSKLYSAPVELRAASRTDAGVHARGQVCAYLPPETGRKEPHGGDPERLAWSLNRQLPPDLRVMAAYRATSLDFHPTFHAIGKQYVYSLEEFPENSHFYDDDDDSDDNDNDDDCDTGISIGVASSGSSRNHFSVPSATDPLRRVTRWQRPPKSARRQKLGMRTSGWAAVVTSGEVEAGGALGSETARPQELGWSGSAVSEACDMLLGTHNFKAFRGSTRRSPLPIEIDQHKNEGEHTPPLPSSESANVCTLTEVSVRVLSDLPSAAAEASHHSGSSGSSGGVSGIGGGSDLGIRSMAGTAHEATVVAAMQGGDGTCSNVMTAREALGRQLLNSDARAVDITLCGDRFVYRMCRNIVGALAEVADGSRSPASVQFALAYGRWPGEAPLPLQKEGEKEANHNEHVYEKDALEDGNYQKGRKSSLESASLQTPLTSLSSTETATEAEIEAALLSQSRWYHHKKGRPLCAPPQGLTLKQVVYHSGSFDPQSSSERGEADGSSSRDSVQGTVMNTSASAELDSGSSSTNSTTTPSRGSPGDSRRSVIGDLRKALPVAAVALMINAPTSTLAAGFGSLSSSSSSQSDSAIVVYGLATAIRARVRVRAVEKSLSAALSNTASASNPASSSSGSSSSASSSSTSSSSVLSDARATAKTVVNGKFVSAANAAVNSLRQAKAPSAQAAADHAFAAREYLSMIVEFDALDDLTFESTGRLGRIVTPEKLAFVRKAANSAGRELDLFLAAFDPNDVANAREILLDAGEPAR